MKNTMPCAEDFDVHCSVLLFENQCEAEQVSSLISFHIQTRTHAFVLVSVMRRFRVSGLGGNAGVGTEASSGLQNIVWEDGEVLY